jgi:selenocysteine lyase/cysteine desulfurase
MDQGEKKEIETLIKLQKSYIITFDTGYGATKQIIKSIQDKFGQHIIHQELPLIFPISGPNEVISLLKHTLRKHIKHNTINSIKLIIIDYIQSNSGLLFPIQELCDLCNLYNIKVLVDGAHTLGSIDLNIKKINPAFFVANAHKWLCSGKGCSLLYVKKDYHQHIIPAVVSHGYSGETLASKFTWIGLQDYCHYLGLNNTLDCWEKIGIKRIQHYISSMIQNIGQYLIQIWNTDLLATTEMFGPMICVRLPGPRIPQSGHEHTDIQDALFYQFNIEAPIKMLQNRLYVRISCHIYNDWEDYRRLAQVMLLIRPKLIGNDDIKDIEFAETADLIKPESGCG